MRIRGLRFHTQYRGAPGTPDLAFPDLRLAVFVDGDLWHGHLQRRIPDYWRSKIDANRDHDAWVNYQLERDGWTVVRFWERDIRRDPEGCVAVVTRAVAHLRPNCGHLNDEMSPLVTTRDQMKR